MARKPKSKGSQIPIGAVRHKDKRKNIPTQELRDFVKADEAKPKKVEFPGLLYARDQSLDPQLVWKGKDEQDRVPLTVPAVPVYIQEKIHPQVIIEEVRAQAQKEKPDASVELFSDFNGIKFEDLVEFYQHEQNWANRMILGDSLLVMTSLAEKEGLKGKVQMIYMDPPYGIKFDSNWQVSTRKREVKDGRAEDLTRQPEQIKAFRDTWQLGIHSYLSYLRDRLVVCRELLAESGSIFVQIGDENVHLVRALLDEVFGCENFVSLISYATTSGHDASHLANTTDFILFYSKDRSVLKYRQIYSDKAIGGDKSDKYKSVEIGDGSFRQGTTEELTGLISLPPKARFFTLGDLTSKGSSEQGSQPVRLKGEVFQCPANSHWKTTQDGIARLGMCSRLVPTGKRLMFKRYIDDFPVFPINNQWTDTSSGFSLSDPKVYVVQTRPLIIERCLLMTTDPGDLVLDPTCGSGTTAYVAEQWGRRWITFDTSRVALALARTRLMAAKYPYYLLADSPEGVAKESELMGRMTPTKKTEGDIKKGFVYKRVPHVTLKSIANNPDIKEGMTREEIDAAIARHADTEILYDQPYEDGKRIRVTGPFTVESLSPHRVLSVDEERPTSERAGQRDATAGQFETMILENLKKAGVQTTVRSERLMFDRLEPYAGEWIHVVGEFTEKGGATRRVAISLGPEHGTVGPEQVKEAAKEALKGAGFDLLVVCGFAFDAHANETAKEFSPDLPKKPNFVAETDKTKRYGKMTVLLARMNPDLAMGDELLKKTGAGNLFMVFGEPDLKVTKEKDGRIVVEVRGVDVYDPTTQQIRSSSTDEIACWFLDTNYNSESFFVRHAYFTGAGEPYEKLKRALRAEIDEAAWSTLYSTKSRPFAPPKTGKIAIKIINHYGDEVLKIYDLKAHK